jgi:hypothetical protein
MLALHEHNTPQLRFNNSHLGIHAWPEVLLNPLILRMKIFLIGVIFALKKRKKITSILHNTH